MTNWCQNKLEVRGSDAVLTAWRAAQRGAAPAYDGHRARVQDVSFNAQVPVPLAVVQRGYSAGGLRDLQRAVLLESGGDDPTPHVPLDGAAWQTLHWGSSRDAEDVTVTAAPGQLVLDFGTAWAPPVPWLAAVAAQWPTLSFELWSIEPGNDLYVHARWVAGRAEHLDERAPTTKELLAWGYDVDDV